MFGFEQCTTKMPVKIERLTITHVRVPLLEPFRISSGAIAEKDGIVVELYAQGLVGVGESSPMAGSFYSPDTPEKCWNELCDVVAPAILNGEFDGSADWNSVLDELPAGNFTRAGVETAFWDLTAQLEDKPLHEMLGGQNRPIEAGLVVGLYDTIANTLRTVERYLVSGYRRLKLKIEPGRDVDIVKAARKEFGNIALSVDANGSYTLDDINVFRALDECGLTMFEQPFPGSFLEEMAELQQKVRTPICLDESLHSSDQLQLAIELGSFRIANFKIQRVGGFHRALEMNRICCEHGIPAWVGTMPELGVGQAQGVALASLPNFVYATDVEASERWYCDDIISPFILVRNGCIELPNRAGLGYDLDRSKMRSYQVASRTFTE
jgi:o-succinylbenzoate synthase